MYRSGIKREDQLYDAELMYVIRNKATGRLVRFNELGMPTDGVILLQSADALATIMRRLHNVVE